MVVLRLESMFGPLSGVYNSLYYQILEHHPSGEGWNHLPNLFKDTAYEANSRHVCACSSLKEFNLWWPATLLKALRSANEVRIVVLEIQEELGTGGCPKVLRGRAQTAVLRSACELLRTYTVNEFLSLSVGEMQALFQLGDYYADEYEWCASTPDHEREEQGVRSPRFAREARRATAKMREPVQARHPRPVQYDNGSYWEVTRTSEIWR